MRLAKFDILYPHEFLIDQQQRNWEMLQKMDFNTYLKWLNSLKIGLYNIFERELTPIGWTVFEYYNQDDLFVEKLAKKHNIRFNWSNIFKKKNRLLWMDQPLNRLIGAIHLDSFRKPIYKQMVIKRFLEIYKPQIIYLREPSQIDNLLWKGYKQKYLVASFIGCNISHPQNWLPHNSDIIFTNIPDFASFFNQNLIESHVLEYGIDAISKEEKKNLDEKYDVTFIGKLGSDDQKTKSETMEAIANRFNFKWWGPKGAIIDQFPALKANWQGYTAGKELFDIYAQSKIVVNDYVHSNGQYSVNMRMKEVMGMCTLLLTRNAINLKEFEDKKQLVTFSTIDDCLDKIDYYLKHDVERKQIAENGWSYVSDNFNYKNVIQTWTNYIMNKYNHKFNV